MLRALVARGLTLGVATAKFTGYAERILEHFAIADCFTVVAGTTQDRVRSPRVRSSRAPSTNSGHPTARARC